MTCECNYLIAFKRDGALFLVYFLRIDRRVYLVGCLVVIHATIDLLFRLMHSLVSVSTQRKERNLLDCHS